MNDLRRDSHLSSEDIAAFIQGELESDQKYLFLQCPSCMARLADAGTAIRPNRLQVSHPRTWANLTSNASDATTGGARILNLVLLKKRKECAFALKVQELNQR